LAVNRGGMGWNRIAVWRGAGHLAKWRMVVFLRGEKLQIPSSKFQSDSRFHGVIESENVYAEKLTVMFSEEVVYAQMNPVEKAAESGREI
jgi:hypothetical protein